MALIWKRWSSSGPGDVSVSVCERLGQEQLKTSYLLAPKLGHLLEMFHTKSCQTAWAKQEYNDSSGTSVSSLKKSDMPLCVYRIQAVIRRRNCWLQMGTDWWAKRQEYEFSVACEGSWCNSFGRGLIVAQSFGAALQTRATEGQGQPQHRACPAARACGVSSPVPLRVHFFLSEEMFFFSEEIGKNVEVLLPI